MGQRRVSKGIGSGSYTPYPYGFGRGSVMEIKIKLNGKMISDDIPADMLLIDFVRAHNCFSVKRGCGNVELWFVHSVVTTNPFCLARRWQLVQMATACTPWRGCKKRRPNLWASLPIKVLNSAVSAIPVSS